MTVHLVPGDISPAAAAIRQTGLAPPHSSTVTHLLAELGGVLDVPRLMWWSTMEELRGSLRVKRDFPKEKAFISQ